MTVTVPGLTHSVGLGDAAKSALEAVGVTQKHGGCGCAQRQAKLNKVLSFAPASLVIEAALGAWFEHAFGGGSRIVSGSIPEGLTFSPGTGILQGEPAQSGSSEFTVLADGKKHVIRLVCQ